MKILVVISFVWLVSVGSTLPASQCSCVAPPAPLAALPAYDAVFAGEVDAVGNFGAAAKKADFTVTRHFRGANVTAISIMTSSDGASCGFNFEQGRSYLVYAYEVDGELWTSICTRTNLLSQATDDLVAFDALDLVEEDGSESPSCGGSTSAAMAQAAMLVFLGLMIRIRRPRELRS